MNPGPARVLVCPKCGTEKKVLSLLSGNTFSGCQWSDTKKDYPMLPSVSPVQKCPKCGCYYFTNRCEIERDNEGYSFELGKLSFEELKEAYVQFIDNNCLQDLTENEKIELLLELLYAYNDKFNRDGIEEKPNQSDLAYISPKVRMLVSILKKRGLSPAVESEYLREIGLFDECLNLLSGYNPENEFMASIVARIKQKAEEGNTRSFPIQ